MKMNFEVIDGSIMNHVTGCLLQEPTIIMMKDVGAPIRFGDYSELFDEFESIKNKFESRGLPEEAQNYELINFNIAHPELGFAPEGYNFTANEICNLFNYLQNFSIGGEKWAEIKLLDYDALKQRLSEIGEMVELLRNR